MAPMALPVPERAVLLANQRLDPAVCTGDTMRRSDKRGLWGSMLASHLLWLVWSWPLPDRPHLWLSSPYGPQRLT
jgi:hypothetical protein